MGSATKEFQARGFPDLDREMLGGSLKNRAKSKPYGDFDCRTTFDFASSKHTVELKASKNNALGSF